MIPDKRWGTMLARVGQPQGYVDDGEGHEDFPEGFVEFLIEVVYDNQVLYSRIVVGKRELTDTKTNLYKLTLDKMVETIDRILDEQTS